MGLDKKSGGGAGGAAAAAAAPPAYAGAAVAAPMPPPAGDGAEQCAEFVRRRALAEQMLACGADRRHAEALTALRVTSPRLEIDGVYTLQPPEAVAARAGGRGGDDAGDRLAWARGSLWLYAGVGPCDGMWIFGDAAEVAEQRGMVRSARRHLALPIECAAWQEIEGPEGWRACGEPVRVSLAHSVDVVLQPRDMACQSCGEKLCLYNPDLDVEHGGRLVCHVCALTGTSKPAAAAGRLEGLVEYIRRRTAEVEQERDRLCQDRVGALAAQAFFARLEGQRGEYDKLRQQVRASVEAAIAYLKREEEAELKRIDEMQRNNEGIARDKLAEAEHALRQLNERIGAADAVIGERHPPSFHHKGWTFLQREELDPVDLPPLGLEQTWEQRWKDPPAVVQKRWDNHLPKLHELPLDKVVPPVGKTVRIPTELLLRTSEGAGASSQTDVGNVCLDGIFFELHLEHPPADAPDDDGDAPEKCAGVFLHCNACDPVFVQMDWSLAVRDLAGEDITEERHATGKFPGDRAIGWHDAIPHRLLVEGQYPCVELALTLYRITAVDLVPPAPASLTRDGG